MIEVVTFDFWQTLVVDTPENLERGRELRLQGIGAVLARAGRPTPRGVLEAAYAASARALVERFWSEQRDLSHEEQVRLFLELAAPGVTAGLGPGLFDEAVRAYTTPVLRLLPTLVSGVREALGGLARRGLRLGIISNTGRTPGVILRQVLGAYGLLDYFGVISYSDEIGYRKPHPEIFRRTLARAGAEPGRVVHVGDDVTADVAGARAVGMWAAHLAGAGSDGAAEAHLVVHDLAELPDRLSRLS